MFFYEDENGYNEVLAVIHDLECKSPTDKSSRINYQKIIAYLDMLEEKGLQLKEPFIKHIEDDIWELRPLRNRIFFAYYKDNRFIVLTYFLKKSQKTPRREIERAKRVFKNFLDGEES